MIKPITTITSVSKQAIKTDSLINKSAAKERITNLIKDFEEVFKQQPENKTLEKHIQNLKESLKKYQ